MGRNVDKHNHILLILPHRQQLSVSWVVEAPRMPWSTPTSTKHQKTTMKPRLVTTWSIRAKKVLGWRSQRCLEVWTRTRLTATATPSLHQTLPQQSQEKKLLPSQFLATMIVIQVSLKDILLSDLENSRISKLRS